MSNTLFLYTLPWGFRVKNSLLKAAMEENLAALPSRAPLKR
jgi:hypothetical protein